MTKRSQQELQELLVSFMRDIGCGRDCGACKFSAKNPDMYFNVTCPIMMVEDMIETKWITPESFDEMLGQNCKDTGRHFC